MKTVFSCFILFIALFAGTVSAQSCCVKPGSDFKLVAMSTDFKEAHLPPEPFSYSSRNGYMISVKTPDGKDANVYVVPSGSQSKKALIIFHEWWGLNDYIKREADKWQELLGDIDVYAIDLYDGKVASDPETASKLASGLDPVRAESIIKGTLERMRKEKAIATLGWCMGGAWSFTASVLAGRQAAGCVMYYGFPERDADKIKALKADVLYIWGSRDKYIKREFVMDFEDKIRTGGHNFDLHEFDADHAFANPSNPKYDKLAAAQAEILAMKFLKEKLDLE